MNRKRVGLFFYRRKILFPGAKLFSYTKLKTEAEKLTSESFTTHHTIHDYIDSGLDNDMLNRDLDI